MEFQMTPLVSIITPTFGSGLPHEAVPVSKLESDVSLPASELDGTKRRPGRTLAARLPPELVGNIRMKSADVRFWHLADILCTRPHVRFRG